MKAIVKYTLISIAFLFVQQAYAEKATAIFAGGCFWCVEADFEKLPGVFTAESGYSGDSQANANYEDVSAGITKHAEAVRVTYDPQKVSYETLVNYFFKHIDPTVKNQQFCDHGPQYRTVIFYGSETEHTIALATKEAILKSGQLKNIETEIVPITGFYLAEEYHQDYYKKNPIRYNYYRASCGRDSRLKEVWGK